MKSSPVSMSSSHTCKHRPSASQSPAPPGADAAEESPAGPKSGADPKGPATNTVRWRDSSSAFATGNTNSCFSCKKGLTETATVFAHTQRRSHDTRTCVLTHLPLRIQRLVYHCRFLQRLFAFPNRRSDNDSWVELYIWGKRTIDGECNVWIAGVSQITGRHVAALDDTYPYRACTAA